MTSMTLLPNFPQLIGSIYPAQTASSRAPVSHLSSQTGKEGSAGLPEHTAKMPSWEEMEERLLLIFKRKSDFQQKPKKSLSCERSELLAQHRWSDQGQEEPAVTQQQCALILTQESQPRSRSLQGSWTSAPELPAEQHARHLAAQHGSQLAKNTNKPFCLPSSPVWLSPPPPNAFPKLFVSTKTLNYFLAWAKELPLQGAAAPKPDLLRGMGACSTMFRVSLVPKPPRRGLNIHDYSRNNSSTER